MEQLCAKYRHLKYEIEDTDENWHLKIIINRLNRVDLIGLTRIRSDDIFHRCMVFDIVGGSATTHTHTHTRLRHIIRSGLFIMCIYVWGHRNISRRYHRHTVGTRSLDALDDFIHYVAWDLLLVLRLVCRLSVYHRRVDEWCATTTCVSRARCLTT